ncbi:PLP-dependent aminotransferase family protein [Modestobacter sp. VKM Ac-2979]|uniref:aminotransferase-like domain-containing protein n=1 Tax=unclassified Modestobacter TaxID=2643866 RepID=UPI0022AB56B6|nr:MULTISPECIES: PLP-dependent aminotransferase family protein [unclassified Modestobacter]MCZ2810546.1 PLP-dependent aminotransferase family protein [Modestobacter sp. VKM Ac-2979]MCZ2842032.1 PLP-dependent aminotransferase family protein [Modestobacter sp. VKM Ac-2980]
MTGSAQTSPATTMISFARGAPSTDIVDVEGLKQAAVAAFDSDPAGMTGYGTAVGYVPLRTWIAEKHGVPVEHVLVTNGSMQADAFLFDELATPGVAVVTERPTYDRTLLGLRNRGADVHLVTLEEDGISVDELAALLDGGLRPTLAHVIPNFQNPAGYTLSLAKRERLLELAREHDFVLFEDDPYVDIRFSGEPLPRMLELDGGAASEHVVYASSFSKTVCPGIRVGYLVGPPALIKKIQVRATNTYIAPNMVAQGTVYAYLQGERFPAALERVKSALAERVGLLDDALREHLPQATFRRPEGGYFLWVSLPEGEGHDVARITTEAAARGVAIVPGTDFLLEGGRNSFRLAYSAVQPGDVDEGVRRLAAAIEAARS